MQQILKAHTHMQITLQLYQFEKQFSGSHLCWLGAGENTCSPRGKHTHTHIYTYCQRVFVFENCPPLLPKTAIGLTSHFSQVSTSLFTNQHLWRLQPSIEWLQYYSRGQWVFSSERFSSETLCDYLSFCF